MQRRVQSSLQSMPVINGWCIAELTAVIYLNENDHNDEKDDDEIFSNSIRRLSKPFFLCCWYFKNRSNRNDKSKKGTKLNNLSRRKMGTGYWDKLLQRLQHILKLSFWRDGIDVAHSRWYPTAAQLKGEYRESEILATNRELTKFPDTEEERDRQYITNETKKYLWKSHFEKIGFYD